MSGESKETPVNNSDITLDVDTVSITIGKSSLTPVQKKICVQVYSSMKDEIVEIIGELQEKHKSPEVITKSLINLICTSIKYMEKVKVNGLPLSGEDKKLIALEIGRVAIKQEIKDKEIQEVVLNIYDVTADPILEGVIDVSREVNAAISKGCKKLFSCCC